MTRVRYLHLAVDDYSWLESMHELAVVLPRGRQLLMQLWRMKRGVPALLHESSRAFMMLGIGRRYVIVKLL